jgi:hypothetical protein
MLKLRRGRLTVGRAASRMRGPKFLTQKYSYPACLSEGVHAKPATMWQIARPTRNVVQS